VNGRAVTPEATALIARTARHFAHKVPVTSSEGNAAIETRFGRAELTTDGDGISIVLDSPDAGALESLRGLLESHLRRFAREPIDIRWSS
jgi:hypothetical protein